MVAMTIAIWIFVFSNSRSIFSECRGYGISLLTMPLALVFMSICNRFSRHKAEGKTMFVIYSVFIVLLMVFTVVVINKIN